MPLSEEELRMLEQMERALVAEDPKLANTLRGSTRPPADRRRVLAAAGVFVLGIVVMMWGAVGQMAVVGVIGFVIMLASATIGLAALRKPSTPAGAAGPRPTGRDGFGVVDGGRSGSRRPRRSGRERTSGSFMERLEERWRRRRESGDF